MCVHYSRDRRWAIVFTVCLCFQLDSLEQLAQKSQKEAIFTKRTKVRAVQLSSSMQIAVAWFLWTWRPNICFWMNRFTCKMLRTRFNWLNLPLLLWTKWWTISATRVYKVSNHQAGLFRFPFAEHQEMFPKVSGVIWNRATVIVWIRTEAEVAFVGISFAQHAQRSFLSNLNSPAARFAASSSSHLHHGHQIHVRWGSQWLYLISI